MEKLFVALYIVGLILGFTQFGVANVEKGDGVSITTDDQHLHTSSTSNSTYSFIEDDSRSTSTCNDISTQKRKLSSPITLSTFNNKACNKSEIFSHNSLKSKHNNLFLLYHFSISLWEAYLL
jgi:hypothetical protein